MANTYTCQVCGQITGRHKKATFQGQTKIVCADCSRLITRARDAARKIPQAMRAAVLSRDGHKCVKCGSVSKLTIDHIKPIAHGGKGTSSNLQTLCKTCNTRKGSKQL